MASDASMQAIGRIERALSREEGIARQLAEARARALDERLAAMEAGSDQTAIDIAPFSREKAIAALKSLDALIGDLQSARSDACWPRSRSWSGAANMASIAATARSHGSTSSPA